MNLNKHIIIVGLPGSGKSALAKALTEEINNTVYIPEPIESTTLIIKSHSFNCIESDVMDCQMIQSYNYLRNFIIASNYLKDYKTSVVQDTSLMDNLQVWHKTLLPYRKYKHIKDIIISNIEEYYSVNFFSDSCKLFGDLVIVLNYEIEDLVKRIAFRGREFEQSESYKNLLIKLRPSLERFIEKDLAYTNHLVITDSNLTVSELINKVMKKVVC